MPFTLQIKDRAPPFSLRATDGKIYSLDSFSDAKLLVIFFTCNHCPYVRNSNWLTREIAEQFKPQGVQFAAINSNSKNTYSEDSFEKMVESMQQEKFPWVYLYDETQDAALKYGALRTPHFFVFDQNRRLIYTGRAIDNPKDPSKRTANDLEKALQQHLEGLEISTPVTNPIGCNVKWEGKEKHWMPPEACDLI